jgi:hypothetical protein
MSRVLILGVMHTRPLLEYALVYLWVALLVELIFW